jgi:hypothetical protein
VSIAGYYTSRPKKHTSVYVRRAEQNIPEHAVLRQSSGRATLAIQPQYRRRTFAMVRLLRKVPWTLESTWFPSSQYIRTETTLIFSLRHAPRRSKIRSQRRHTSLYVPRVSSTILDIGVLVYPWKLGP